MTAEIALLNKEAVALAADSAITISLPNGQHKILPSANKIFSLSKYQPVGIMIYGNAQLAEVPWEVMIKEYRRGLQESSFGTLEEYAEDFIKYLTESSAFFPASAQERSLINEVRYVFESIAEEFVAAQDAITTASDEDLDEDADAFLSGLIERWHQNWEQLTPVASLPVGFAARLREMYGDAVESTIADVFNESALSDVEVAMLVDLAIWWIERYPILQRPAYSGLVIAGFGRKDVFPSLRAYHIGGIAADVLVYDVDRKFDVAASGAAILPFAQFEMVSAFMEGIDTRFFNQVTTSFGEALLAMSEFALQNAELSPEKVKELEQLLSEGRDRLVRHFAEELERFKSEQFALPVVRVTSMLPKAELAAMAEALVNLTSFKRKVSEEAETVGGPIDVALISKGDGFIWVKRKHYFDPALNPQFFANYYREDTDVRDDARARSSRSRAAIVAPPKPATPESLPDPE